MAKCIIVGAGEMHGVPRVCKCDLVIAADGGYSALLSLGITPDLVVGDLDSESADIPEGTRLIKFPVQKDETDMDLAFREGYRRGYREFEIYGGTGGRLDHTLANLSLLLAIKERGADARLIGNGCECFVLQNEARTVCGKPGQGISVFAMRSAAEGVSVSGFKYTCNGARLDEGFAIGVSNSFIKDSGTVEVKSGTLLVVKEI